MKRSSILSALPHIQWLLLLLAAPILLRPSPRYVWLILAIPLIFLLNFVLWRKPVEVTPLNTSLLLLLFMVLVSTWATYDLTISLEKIAGVVFGFCVFFVVAQHGQRRGEWTLILVSYLLISVGIACLGLLGTKWLNDKFQALNIITSFFPSRLKGVAGAQDGFHPNEVAGTLLWSIPVALSLFIGSFRNKTLFRSLHPRWFSSRMWSGLAILTLGGIALLIAGVFLIAQSRGGYLALVAAFLVMLWFILPALWRKPVLMMSLVLIVAAGVWLFFVRSSPFIDNLLFTPENIQNSTFSVNSMQGRLEIWSSAVYAIRDFPLTGMGMNTFRYAGRFLYPLFIDPTFNFGHAHNELLQAALDLGLPGLISFLSIYAIAFWMLFRLFQRAERGESTDFPLKAVVLGLGGGLFAHLLYGLTDAISLGAKPGFVFWMLLGLITSLYMQYEEELRESSTCL